MRETDDPAPAAVPTMVAGIYGMNFDQMPELTRGVVLPAVLLLMADAVYGLFLLFKRCGWL